MTILIILNIISIVIISITIYLILKRIDSGEKYLVLSCMRVSLLYCVLELAEHFWGRLMNPNLLIIVEIVSVLVVGILFIFYFHYAISMTKYRMKRNYIAIIMMLYTVSGLFLLTSSYHHCFYKKLSVVEDVEKGLRLEKEMGSGYYLFTLLLFLTSILIINMGAYYYKETKENYGEDRKKRARIVLGVTFVPIFMSVLFLIDSLGNYDLACVGMGISGIVLIYAMKHFNYMDAIQTAKDLVVENMNIGVLIFDKDYHLLEGNQFMKERFSEAWENPELMEENEQFRKAIHGELDKVEWNGHIYSCQNQYEKIMSRSNVLRGYVMTIYDITALEEHAKQLEVLKQEAEEANKQKTNFLANVTHEIRTPLNTIMGMSEIAVRKSTEKSIEGTLKSIYRESEGVLDLVDTLLDISKLESGTIELSHEMYQMEDILYEISNMVYTRIGKKDLDFKVEVKPGFPHAFYGDSVRVKEIFQNLLGNAIKYTENGSIVLALDGEKEEDNRFKILLTVQDTGAGMDEEDSKSIFQRFMRSKNPKTASVFGAGLGLDITMNLVKLMDGGIQVQSKLGEGTTFLAFFYQEIADSEPLQLGNITRETAEKHMENKDFLDEIHVAFPGARVLIVDDMESNLTVERGLMELYGIEPEMALSGQQALEKLETEKYDLIFLDHMMPQMDGIQTLQEIRRMKNGKEVPVVAVTANAVAYTTDFYEKNGFDDSLAKPLRTAELLEVLKKYIPFKIQNREEEESSENLPIKSLMPEIDCVEGIKNIGGNLEKYNELLRVYNLEMVQILEVLPDLADEDLEAFKIKVHGIKGSSRNIGAEQLSRDALQLEEWAKEGKKEEILGRLDDFLKELDVVMTRIDSYLKEVFESTQRDGDFLPELELTSVYAILRALSEFDMDEVEEELKELYKNRYTDDTEEVLEKLKRYVEALDYKNATALLEDYLEKIG
ncbi:MAG: ATP-binding protein [Lachnospiraceae bacterium]